MKNRTEEEHLLRELEQRLLDPEARRAPETVSALLAADFVEFGRSGIVYERQRIIGGLQTEVPALRTMTDVAVRWLADTVALLTYRSSRHDDESGETVHSLRSSIWRRTDGRWQMVFHQGTATDAAQ